MPDSSQTVSDQDAPEIDFEARTHVHEVVDASGTSFLAAMKILPEERREAMFAIYAFCREIDDIADEPAPVGEKIHRLQSWRREVERLYEGHPDYLTSRALLRPTQLYGFEKQNFLDLIDGMEMDALEDICAPSLSRLDTYCDRVASAVGRLSVRAFGAKEDRAREVAHWLGRALQLTNILRDLKEDAERGRLYLPEELLEARGIRTRVPEEVLAHPNLPQVCADLTRRARDAYHRSGVAMRKCARKPMKPARLMMQVYRAVLKRLEKRGWERLDQEVSLAAWQKLWIALRYGLI
jgi:phytoene synthase